MSAIRCTAPEVYDQGFRPPKQRILERFCDDPHSVRRLATGGRLKVWFQRLRSSLSPQVLHNYNFSH